MNLSISEVLRKTKTAKLLTVLSVTWKQPSPTSTWTFSKNCSTWYFEQSEAGSHVEDTAGRDHGGSFLTKFDRTVVICSLEQNNAFGASKCADLTVRFLGKHFIIDSAVSWLICDLDAIYNWQKSFILSLLKRGSAYAIVLYGSNSKNIHQLSQYTVWKQTSVFAVLLSVGILASSLFNIGTCSAPCRCKEGTHVLREHI